MNMKLCYLGHSCFKVESKGYEIVLDPYGAGSVPGLGDLDVEADMCLCSHGHGDHHGTEGVKLREGSERNPFQIEKVESWHDDQKGELRGSNTIHILHAEDMKVVHMGDVGCVPEEWQLRVLAGADVLLVPVGGYYTAEPDVIRQIVDRIHPRVTVPMHYRSAKSGFPVLKTLDAWLSFCQDVIRYETDTLVVDKKTRTQTAVLLQRMTQ